MTYYRCECGKTVPTMDRFVDHVTEDHNALDVAVRSLLAEEVKH